MAQECAAAGPPFEHDLQNAKNEGMQENMAQSFSCFTK